MRPATKPETNPSPIDRITIRATTRIAFAAALCIAPLIGLAGCGTAQPRVIRSAASDDALVQQRRFDWCWAACCEMAYRAQGRHDITQEKLVAAMKGGGTVGGAHDERLAASEDDHRAHDFELVRALAVGTDFYLPIGVYPNGGVRFSREGLADYIEAWAGLYLASSVAVEDLDRGEPVLAVLRDWEGAPGHVGFVLEVEATPHSAAHAAGELYKIGCEVGEMLGLGQDDGDGDSLADYLPDRLPRPYELHRITFYDPSFEAPGVRTIEGDAIERHLAYLLSPSMAQAILAREREIVTIGAVPSARTDPRFRR
ncbi:MAG: hypothetical protein GC172_14150 [Phycisphaera sp.]|nr:hypothetical protein [Phycisphaera sp.]